MARSGPSSLAVDPAGSTAARWRRRLATGMTLRAPAALSGLGSHGKEARPRRQAGVETARVSRRRLVVCANQEAERDATGRTPHETRACQARACLSRIALVSQLQIHSGNLIPAFFFFLTFSRLRPVSQFFDELDACNRGLRREAQRYKPSLLLPCYPKFGKVC